MIDPFQANRLGEETSPYLLQHKDNPVHWQPWRQEVLDYAQSQDKPILLSIGYAACHWCHVMEHESFEDPAIAALMNENFVSIKVDREERPDVDTIYMNALTFLGQPGGWPLTMFLTPEGKPFWGGTYFPPEAKYGRPAFPDMLKRIAEVYRNEKNTVNQNVSALTDRLNELVTAPVPGIFKPEAEARVSEAVLRQIDRHHGGIGDAPKFPQPYIYEMLWRTYLGSGDNAYYNAVTRTLDHIAQGGIYDHLGGGFSRYTVDNAWLVPHFEKMLYDNAQFISLYTHVWQESRNPLYQTRIRETVDWALREMITRTGAFAASQDADSDGEEGKFYVWTADEIKTLIGDDFDLFAATYDVRQSGNWEGKTILNRLNSMAVRHSPEQEGRLARARKILFEARQKRIKPGWDDKVLADWNGLMIAALAEAGAIFDERPWIDAARRAFDAIVSTHADPSAPNRLLHSSRNGTARHTGMLDDYAFMAHAALALHEITGDDAYVEKARAWMDVLDAHYLDAERGGYYLTADDAEALITRSRGAIDNAAPAGNAVAALVLALLYHLTGEESFRERADRTITAFAGDLGTVGMGFATLIRAYETLTRAIDIIIIGRRGEPATDAMIRQVRQTCLPNHTLQVVASDASLPDGHPAHGKTDAGSVTAAYVCVENRCSAPLTDADALAVELVRVGSRTAAAITPSGT